MGRLFDTRELGGLFKELAVTIPRANIRNQSRAVRATSHEGSILARANARRTSGAHGKYYPPSIRSRRIAATTYEFGPEGKAENWSFEDGSRKQPPHRDHARAADRIEGRLPLRSQAAAEDAFVGW